MKPTQFMIRVLDAINSANSERQFTSPSWIANRVFPRDHPGWKRSCKCGAYGSTKGSGLVMMMGGYIGKLSHATPPLVVRGYSNDDVRTYLTLAGENVLRDNRQLMDANAET